MGLGWSGGGAAGVLKVEVGTSPAASADPTQPVRLDRLHLALT